MNRANRLRFTLAMGSFIPTGYALVALPPQEWRLLLVLLGYGMAFTSQASSFIAHWRKYG